MGFFGYYALALIGAMLFGFDYDMYLHEQCRGVFPVLSIVATMLAFGMFCRGFWRAMQHD